MVVNVWVSIETITIVTKLGDAVCVTVTGWTFEGLELGICIPEVIVTVMIPPV